MNSVLRRSVADLGRRFPQGDGPLEAVEVDRERTGRGTGLPVRLAAHAAHFDLALGLPGTMQAVPVSRGDFAPDDFHAEVDDLIGAQSARVRRRVEGTLLKRHGPLIPSKAHDCVFSETGI